jgi:hypothetical protein
VPRKRWHTFKTGDPGCSLLWHLCPTLTSPSATTQPEAPRVSLTSPSGSLTSPSAMTQPEAPLHRRTNRRYFFANSTPKLFFSLCVMGGQETSDRVPPLYSEGRRQSLEKISAGVGHRCTRACRPWATPHPEQTGAGRHPQAGRTSGSLRPPLACSQFVAGRGGEGGRREGTVVSSDRVAHPRQQGMRAELHAHALAGARRQEASERQAKR